MDLYRFQDPGEYRKFAQPYLEAQEAANSLLLGIAIRLDEHPEWIDSPPYLAIAAEAGSAEAGSAEAGSAEAGSTEAGGDLGRVALVAAITPPHNVLLAGDPQVDPAALSLLVDNLRQEGWSFPGVNGENRLARRFAEAWSQANSSSFHTRMRLRLYELRQVIPPNPIAPGRLRQAALADLDLVTRWRAEFTRESLHQEPSASVREQAQRLIQDGATYLWEHGGPVSMAVAVRPTPHGISIGAVYTPPELRSCGYASACVAALSQLQLDAGRSFCTLFTDLDYPTSNSIYQKIGYRPVCDFTEYGFAA